MTEVVEGVSPDEMFSAAVANMCEKNQSCIMVTRESKPVGIITERDIVSIFNASLSSQGTKQQVFDQLTVNDVLAASTPICVKQSSSLYDAIVLANGRKLRHLMVIDDDEKLVGLVTQTDMVNTYFSIIERQAELETANQELHLLSHEDALMQIGNRRAMEVEMDFTEAWSKRYGKDYSVALMDVDYFKKYNDEYGHQAGDDALVAIANALKETMRETDRLYRYGGEELLMLMPETEAKEALVASERARVAVDSLNLPHSESPFGRVTMSVGVASSSDEEWQILVDFADTALYKAKHSGRNNTCEAKTDK